LKLVFWGKGGGAAVQIWRKTTTSEDGNKSFWQGQRGERRQKEEK